MIRVRALAATAGKTCLGAGLLLVHHGAPAQSAWKPERAVEIIVTCQPGCGPDIAARTIQKIWQDHRIVEAPAVVRHSSPYPHLAGGSGRS